MHNDDQLERAINEALSTYIEEPRPGLENRVLANIAGAKPRVHWLRWGIAFATVACMAFAIALSQRTTHKMSEATRRRAPEIVQHPAIRPALPPVQQARVAPSRKHVVRATLRPEPLPKLAQFPTPAPLTEDERALTAFAQRAKPEALKAVAQSEQRETAPIEIPKLQIVELQIPPLSEGGN